jgi:hypothetical protein
MKFESLQPPDQYLQSESPIWVGKFLCKKLIATGVESNAYLLENFDILKVYNKFKDVTKHRLKGYKRVIEKTHETLENLVYPVLTKQGSFAGLQLKFVGIKDIGETSIGDDVFAYAISPYIKGEKTSTYLSKKTNPFAISSDQFDFDLNHLIKRQYPEIYAMRIHLVGFNMKIHMLPTPIPYEQSMNIPVFRNGWNTFELRYCPLIVGNLIVTDVSDVITKTIPPLSLWERMNR